MKVRFTQLRVIAIFSTNISQGTVATLLRCGGVFYYYIARNALFSLSLKKMKIG